MKELEDTDLISASILKTFFFDVNNSKDSLAGYRSIILRLTSQLGITPEKLLENINVTEKDKFLGNLDDHLKNAMIQWSDSVRHNVERCESTINSLVETGVIDYNIDELKNKYEKIITVFSPDLANVSFYVFEADLILHKSTLEKTLRKMETFYEQFKRE